MDIEKSKILIVDDIPNNLKLLGNILRNEGYRVSFAENGKKALEAVSYKEFDLILLDIMMPEMDGYEVLEILKADPFTAKVPVIMLSAKDETNSLVKCFEAGAVDYVTKPYKQQELLARIKTHIELIATTKLLSSELEEHEKAKIELQKYIRKTEQANEKLEENAAELCEKNLELAAAKEELSETVQRLRQANQSKDKLFSIIAHDLRGPIGAISMSLELYLKDDFDAGFETNMLSELEKSAKSTYNLLENLLFWARSQRKELNVTPRELSLEDIIEDNLDLLNSSAKHKNINLQNNLKRDYRIKADYNLIITVVRNLISNAIKFTPENGTICINAEPKNDFVVVSVSDTGIGIDKSTLEKIFNPDTRYTTLGTNHEKGTGLGLMLCKEFVEKNGGEIWVESKKEEGTTFYFSVPLLAI